MHARLIIRMQDVDHSQLKPLARAGPRELPIRCRMDAHTLFIFAICGSGHQSFRKGTFVKNHPK
jgi:hypothetical protein